MGPPPFAGRRLALVVEGGLGYESGAWSYDGKGRGLLLLGRKRKTGPSVQRRFVSSRRAKTQQTKVPSIVVVEQARTEGWFQGKGRL